MKVLEILSKILDDISHQRVLLWTNPNPTSAFNAKTLTLDLSDYSSVEIVSEHWINNSISTINKVDVGMTVICVNPNMSNSTIAIRSATVSTTGITFSSGSSITGTSMSSNDNGAIPLKIYGIK